MTMSNNINGQFGDTTLTKVFVGGLAWETPKEALREHFEKFGEIFEAVIISDKLTGRSKGYGFVTFKEAEAAKKACEDSTPIINGRRANCNLASLGARSRPRSASNASNTNPPHPHPPLQHGSNVGPRSMSSAPANHVQWYSPTYIAADISYSHRFDFAKDFDMQKLSYSGGNYMSGHFSQVYPGQAMMGANTLMPMYPLYHYHQSHTMGLPAHMFPPTTAGPITTVPAIMSKPASIASSTDSLLGCGIGTVGAGESFKKVGGT
ncbi:hypothetical protein FEM48_Zijuj03G0084000 [Ziziphus jujuba var. spinosa]|uniref:RRM domain-containing protein n=1 Tax=Ziziphus jujuba var. spinosa TaxID=714518 RepID=A0A978VP82_ZIZJJ|nr:hypothetical protein FEM48_Zijuj03G0084000 [Ziziphus jujuba var. spinosa]